MVQIQELPERHTNVGGNRRASTPTNGRVGDIHTTQELNIQGCYDLIQAILAPMFRRAEIGDWKALGYIQSADAEHWGKLVCRDVEAWRRYVDNWLRDMLIGNHN